MSASQALYTPIQPYQTRIVCLRGKNSNTTFDSRLICDLYVADILHDDFKGLGLRSYSGDRSIEYTALSYTWGSEEKPHTLLCNTVEFPIGKNLWKALRALRDVEGRDQYLWVDAICINQSDMNERSIQVRNMFLIYRKAVQVIAWIDSADEEPMPDMEIVLTSAEDVASRHIVNGAFDFWKTCKALTYIYTRDWFTRIWVQQEVFASRKLQLQSGSYRFEWTGLVSDPDLLSILVRRETLNDPSLQPFLAWYRKHENSQASHTTPAEIDASQLQAIEKLKEVHSEHIKWFSIPRHSKKNPNLVQTLLNTGVLGARNPLDYIYGIIGITGLHAKAMTVEEWTIARRHEIFVPIDYSADMVSILSTVTWAVLMAESNGRVPDLSVLAKFKAFCTYQSEGEHERALPSWVIDWRLASASWNVDWPLDMVQIGTHYALGLSNEVRLPYGQFFKDNSDDKLPHGHLVLRGLIDSRWRIQKNRVYKLSELWPEDTDRGIIYPSNEMYWDLSFDSDPRDLIVNFLDSSVACAQGLWLLRAVNENEYRLMAFLSWWSGERALRYNTVSHVSPERTSTHKLEPDSYRRLLVQPLGVTSPQPQYRASAGIPKYVDAQKFIIV